MLDRRQFLSAAAVGAAMTVAGSGGIDHDPTPDLRVLAQPELLVSLGPEAVREIGQAYRRLVPAENDRVRMERRLRAELRTARYWNEDPVRADFTAGHVIVVKQWILSRTEARQCALLSML